MKSFEELYEEILERKKNMPEGSRTTELLTSGIHGIGKKVVEEAAEVWIAAEYESDEQLALEISQLLYYCAVIAAARDLKLTQIYEEL